MNQPLHLDPISSHYSRPGLTDAIIAGLREAGEDPDRFDYQALSPVDHFHTLGKEATEQLARLAGVRSGLRVLDVGGGLGGPARMLAAQYGCEVTVVDITEDYCQLGQWLTERAGLADKVRFQHGDALSLPFADGNFDLVWTQHCTMNISDKGRLYHELARVLPSGGRLAFHEIMAGPVQPVRFPVPWASCADLSDLVRPSEVHAHLEAAGLQVVEYRDGSAAACEWFRQRFAQAPAAPPPLGLHLLVGPQAGEIFKNVLDNYSEGRILVIQAVCRKY